MNPAPSSIWSLYVEAANAQFQIRGIPGEMPVDKFGGKRSMVFWGGWGEVISVVAMLYGDPGDPTNTTARLVSDGSSVLSIFTPLPVGAMR